MAAPATRADIKEAMSLLRTFLSFRLREAHLFVTLLDSAESIIAGADVDTRSSVCSVTGDIRSTLITYNQLSSERRSNRVMGLKKQLLGKQADEGQKVLRELKAEWESEKSILSDLKSQLHDLQQKVADSEQRAATKASNLTDHMEMMKRLWEEYDEAYKVSSYAQNKKLDEEKANIKAMWTGFKNSLDELEERL
ncbi:hypothetical protein Dimus_029856 [Dionaea muscipula]